MKRLLCVILLSFLLMSCAVHSSQNKVLDGNTSNNALANLQQKLVRDMLRLHSKSTPPSDRGLYDVNTEYFVYMAATLKGRDSNLLLTELLAYQLDGAGAEALSKAVYSPDFTVDLRSMNVQQMHASCGSMYRSLVLQLQIEDVPLERICKQPQSIADDIRSIQQWRETYQSTSSHASDD